MIHSFWRVWCIRINAQNVNQCRNRCHEQLNSSWAGLSAGAKSLYVTVWLFTIDVWMLRLRKMSRTDFKHSITYSPSFPFWKYPSPYCVSPGTESFFLTYGSFLNQNRTRHFIYFFKVTLFFPKMSFENVAQNFFSFLIKNISYCMWTCFEGLFSYSLCPWIKRGLTKQKSPLNKDPIALPLSILKPAL